MARKKILIIDDEKDIADLLKFNLEKEGYETLSVKEAEKGLAAIRKHRPDLILLDLILPDIDGFEFCRMIRQETDTPIIFLTGSKNEVCRKLAFTLGANDYFCKPFSIESVLKRIEKILS